MENKVLKEITGVITKAIEDYNSSNNHPPEALLDMGRAISANLFFLEEYRTEAHLRYETTVFNLKKQGWKVNASINEAEVKVPELYELRRFMDSADRVLGMIRSDLSWKKTEMNNTNISG